MNMISSENNNSADIISRLYINTASFEKEYAWYSIDDTGLIHELQDAPDEYEVIYQCDFTRNRSLLLFTNDQGVCVYWGRDDLILPEDAPKGDWIGRTLGYTGLIVFKKKEAALEFYGGLLRHWWLSTSANKSAISDIATQVGLIMSKDNLAADRLYSAIINLVTHWQNESIEEAINEKLRTDQPLISLENPQRLAELTYYIRHDLMHSEAMFSAMKPIVVVAHTLSVSRLRGIWRAITNINSEESPIKSEWSSNVLSITKSKHSSEKDIQSKKKSPLQRAAFNIEKMWHKFTARHDHDDN